MILVIFDMDGTLVDSAALMVESAIAACNAIGIVAPDDKTIRSISGLDLAEGLRRLAPAAQAFDVQTMASAYREAYTEKVRRQLREPLFPGTLDALERLSRRDDTLMAIATGKALRGAQRVLELHEIAHLFTSVQTPDHNPSKPHPGMVHAAIDEVGAELSSTVMIGDTTHDIEMARAAGVKALGVSWGYHDADELLRAGAHVIVDRYEDLIAAIDEQMGANA